MIREEGDLDDILAYPLLSVTINYKVDCDLQPAFTVSAAELYKPAESKTKLGPLPSKWPLQ